MCFCHFPCHFLYTFCSLGNPFISVYLEITFCSNIHVFICILVQYFSWFHLYILTSSGLHRSFLVRGIFILPVFSWPFERLDSQIYFTGDIAQRVTGNSLRFLQNYHLIHYYMRLGSCFSSSVIFDARNLKGGMRNVLLREDSNVS